MQVTVESTGTLERRMRVELPAERIESEVDSRLKVWGRKAKIKGFRPGKVPPKVVKQHYGAQIREEVLNEITQKSYTDALMQENLNPAGGPRIEPDVGADKASFAYVATFEVMPEVQLKGLDKIKIEKPEVSIGDEDMDDMILKLRKQKAPGKKSIARAVTVIASSSISRERSRVRNSTAARAAMCRSFSAQARCCPISKKD